MKIRENFHEILTDFLDAPLDEDKLFVLPQKLFSCVDEIQLMVEASAQTKCKNHNVISKCASLFQKEWSVEELDQHASQWRQSKYNWTIYCVRYWDIAYSPVSARRGNSSLNIDFNPIYCLYYLESLLLDGRHDAMCKRIRNEFLSGMGAELDRIRNHYRLMLDVIQVKLMMHEYAENRAEVSKGLDHLKSQGNDCFAATDPHQLADDVWYCRNLGNL